MGKRTHERDPQRLRDVLGEIGARLGIDRPAEIGHLWARWRDIVGDAIADHAEPTSLRKGVLRVRAESPAWATEIGYLGEQIAARANAALAAEIVTEVRTWTGPAPSRPEHAASRAAPNRKSGAVQPTVGEPHTETPEDPVTALNNARRAWERWRRKGPSAAPEETGETPRKSR